MKKGNNKEDPLVRIHSQCITGDILDSLKCDCGSQLKKSIEIMSNDGGILLYMPKEGRNIGLLNKLRSYEFQFHGIDTIDANYALGFDADQRRHENACKLLKLLGVNSIELITNNPEKISQVQKGGIKIINTVQIKLKVAAEARRYMETKKNRSVVSKLTIIGGAIAMSSPSSVRNPCTAVALIRLNQCAVMSRKASNFSRRRITLERVHREISFFDCYVASLAALTEHFST